MTPLLIRSGALVAIIVGGSGAGGSAFDKCTLYKLLTNRTYTGVVS